MPIPKWTNEERNHQTSLDIKLEHVKDLLRGVVEQFHTGFFLWGEGGTSKSYTLMQELKRRKTKYRLHNTRLTGRGLFNALQMAPTDIHFIEDAETLMDDKKSFGVLRSALWSQSRKKPPERQITWGAHGADQRFIFTGGIIIVSNANLAESIPEIRALRTRITVQHLDVTDQEIRALGKSICEEGYSYGPDYLSPDECWEVQAYISQKMEILNRSLDLRLLITSFHDYLQWKAGHSTGHWHELVESRMAERVVAVGGRTAETASKRKIAQKIHANTALSGKAKLAAWKKQTAGDAHPNGLGRAAFYRALKR